jgi:membrane associated rhomboid family serine protease
MNSDVLSITNIIVGITCPVSFLLMEKQTGKALLIFHPATIRERHQWYRFVTSGFVHADVMHLAVNMFVLWSFGNAIERYYYPALMGDFAAQKYMVLYFGGVWGLSVTGLMNPELFTRFVQKVLQGPS